MWLLEGIHILPDLTSTALESEFWKFPKYLLKENFKLPSCKLDIIIEFYFPTIIIHTRSVMFKRQELTECESDESGARNTEKLFTCSQSAQDL